MAYFGNTPADSFTAITKDTFSGDGSTTAFTLTNPATTNGVQVFVENVRQEPTDAYTVSGTTLTFTAAPVTGTDNIYVVNSGTPVSTITHPAGAALQATSGTFSGNVSTSGDLKVDVSSGGTYTVTGTDTATNRTLTLPDETGTVLTSGTSVANFPSGFANGITMADQFRATSDTTGAADIANVERTDESTSGTIGTGMTESSGIFTFPSTGIYLVLVTAEFLAQGGDTTVQLSIQVTTDNSSFTEYAICNGGNSGASDTSNQGSAHLVLDITDTTNQKIKFRTSSLTGSSAVRGNTDRNETSFTFIKLGDT